MSESSEAPLSTVAIELDLHHQDRKALSCRLASRSVQYCFLETFATLNGIRDIITTVTIDDGYKNSIIAKVEKSEPGIK